MYLVEKQTWKMQNGLLNPDVRIIEPSTFLTLEVMQLRLLTRRLRSYKQRQTPNKEQDS